jgi:hypothetical protein
MFLCIFKQNSLHQVQAIAECDQANAAGIRAVQAAESADALHAHAEDDPRSDPVGAPVLADDRHPRPGHLRDSTGLRA